MTFSSGAMTLRGSSSTPAATVPPIQGLLVQGPGDAVGASLDFLTQPAPASVVENDSASFSVTVTNFSYYTTNVWYQWLKNGNLIPGAMSSKYVISVAA